MMFRRVRESVMAATNEQQVPWEYGSLTGEFYFRAPGKVPADEPEVAGNAYLPTYCYAAAHIVTLLTDGFGFAADTDRISAPLKLQRCQSWRSRYTPMRLTSSGFANG